MPHFFPVASALLEDVKQKYFQLPSGSGEFCYIFVLGSGNSRRSPPLPKTTFFQSHHEIPLQNSSIYVSLPAAKTFCGHNLFFYFIETTFTEKFHCAKNVQIQSFFWSLFSRIQSKYRKIWTRKSSVSERRVHVF